MNRFDTQSISEAYISIQYTHNLYEQVNKQSAEVPPQVKEGMTKFVEMAIQLQEDQENGTKLNPE